jgi:hypothetical protein
MLHRNIEGNQYCRSLHLEKSMLRQYFENVMTPGFNDHFGYPFTGKELSEKLIAI